MQAAARQFDCTICEYQVQTQMESFLKVKHTDFDSKYGHTIIPIVSCDVKHEYIFYFFIFYVNEQSEDLAIGFNE